MPRTDDDNSHWTCLPFLCGIYSLSPHGAAKQVINWPLTRYRHKKLGLLLSRWTISWFSFHFFIVFTVSRKHRSLFTWLLSAVLVLHRAAVTYVFQMIFPQNAVWLDTCLWNNKDKCYMLSESREDAGWTTTNCHGHIDKIARAYRNGW